MDPQTQTDEEPNEFSALETLDALAAFLHQKYGEQALREVFAMFEELYREPLEKTAEVLNARGLSHVANVMADIAASCPSEIESNPYPPDSFNGRYWAQRWLQKQWQSSPEFEKHLRAQKSKNTPKPSLRRH
jgi:hypothetical protein